MSFVRMNMIWSLCQIESTSSWRSFKKWQRCSGWSHTGIIVTVQPFLRCLLLGFPSWDVPVGQGRCSLWEEAGAGAGSLSTKDSPLSFCSLLIFWEIFCVRGFENGAMSWVCFKRCRGIRALLQNWGSQCYHSFTLCLLFSRLAPCLYASGVLGHTSTSLLKELLPHYPFWWVEMGGLLTALFLQWRRLSGRFISMYLTVNILSKVIVASRRENWQFIALLLPPQRK